MNNVNIIGRIGSDILKFNVEQFNKYVYKFALAFDNRTRKTDGVKDTYFIECEAWDEVGKRLYENVAKGDRIAISGHLEQAKFTKKDGSKGSLIKIVVSTIEFLSPKRDKVAEELKENNEPTYDEEETDLRF